MTRQSVHYWNSISGNYDTLYEDAWSRAEDSELSRLLTDLLRRMHARNDNKSGIRVLDLACGTGLVAEMLSEIAAIRQYHGVDISPKMLELCDLRCRKLGIPYKLTEANLDIYSISEAPYDLIICANSGASFMRDPISLLDNISQYLSNDGAYLFQLLNRCSLRRLIHVRFGKFETYSTRGSTYSSHDTARLVTKRELKSTGIANTRNTIIGDGPMTGVFQWTKAFRVNRLIGRLTTCLSHSIILMGDVHE